MCSDNAPGLMRAAFQSSLDNLSKHRTAGRGKADTCVALMAVQPKAKGGKPYQSTGSQVNPADRKATFTEAGIDKHLADRAPKLAVIPNSQDRYRLQDDT